MPTRNQQVTDKNIIDLERELAEKTAELAQRNRDLQIEASLEQVRSSAMRMRNRADMLEICKTISKQLATLGVNEIRNVQTAIFNVDRGTYFNYEYYAKHNKTVFTETDYKNHPVHLEFADQMLKGTGELFIRTITRKELPDWISYQKTTNVFIDSFLESAPSLTYHWYSLGAVALGISTYEPLTDQEIQLFKRFKNVFELSYRRYLDIEQAEAQTHEAKMEASLEKVRAQAMAMHSTEELKNVSEIIFHELESLGFAELRNTEIIVNNDEKETVLSHYCDYGVTGTIEVDYKTNPILQKWANEMKSASDAFTSVTISEKEIAAWRKLREEIGYQPDPKLNAASSVYYYSCSTGLGALSVSTFFPLNDDQQKTLGRFRNVFTLAYRRYVDVALAEAQARESQIQLALERVRARTMAMQKSDELAETVYVLFQQFRELGENPDMATIGIINEAENVIDYWVTMYGNQMNRVFKFSIEEPHVTNKIYKGWKEGKKSLVIDLSGNDLHEFMKYRESMGGAKRNPEEKRRIINVAFFSKGLLNVQSNEAKSEESIRLLERFAVVFEQTYTRFLDLKRAEEQAYEAKIEASLERVRAKAMAMHQSTDLTEAAGALFTELNKIGINPIRSGFVLLTKDSRRAKLYPATSFDQSVTLSFTGEFEFVGHPVFEKQYESWQKTENYFPVLEGGVMKSYYEILSRELSVPREYFPTTQKQFGSFLPFSGGFLFTWSIEPYSEKEISILERFKSILDLTIRRYIDLQKAEAQAKEARIEAALERVRSRSMGMQKSEELKEVIQIVYEQFVHLNIHIEHAGFIMDYKTRDDMHIWLADQHEVPSEITIPYFDSPHWNSFMEAKEKGTDFFTNQLSFEEKNKFYKDLFRLFPVPDEAKEYYFNCAGLAISTVLLENVGLYIENFSGIPYTDEENDTMVRFGKVFQQTYTRFLDLQKAEAQAREARIEAGLERVRGRTLAMHSSDELAETSAVLFRQLMILGIAPNRLYISIMQDENANAEFWITDEDGSKVSFAYRANLLENQTFKKMYAGWTEQEKSITIDMYGEELEEYFKYLTSLHVPFKDGRSQKHRVQTIAYFSQGFIGIASPDAQPEETTALLERFAYVFNLTYTRFSDLKVAEGQAKKAQMEAAMERVRGRALAMQQPEELMDVAETLRREMGALGMAEIETGTIFIFDESSETAEFGFTARDFSQPDKPPVTDTIKVDLNQTWAGKMFLKFFRSPETKMSLQMEGEQRKEWIHYIYSNSGKANNYFGENIRDRTYHLLKFSTGAVAAVTDGPALSDESWELLSRAASVFSLAYSRFKDLTQARIDLQNLKEEKKRSESLLLNILPEEIAAELKQFGKSYARKYDQVTILFADIKGFSSIAETLSAQELVTQLDECFRAFDHIVDKHGLEKIKTVGDAYVCACGLPKPVPDNAVKAVRAAIDMMSFIKGFSITRRIQDLPAFEFRIGINTGPVVTGVVGLRKFTYDIWGDAVNMAARMEQHGEAGKINISQNTYELIKDKFTCTSRGKIAAKNKGEVEMYFVNEIN